MAPSTGTPSATPAVTLSERVTSAAGDTYRSADVPYPSGLADTKVVYDMRGSGLQRGAGYLAVVIR